MNGQLLELVSVVLILGLFEWKAGNQTADEAQSQCLGSHESGDPELWSDLGCQHRKGCVFIFLWASVNCKGHPVKATLSAMTLRHPIMNNSFSVVRLLFTFKLRNTRGIKNKLSGNFNSLSIEETSINTWWSMSQSLAQVHILLANLCHFQIHAKIWNEKWTLDLLHNALHEGRWSAFPLLR